MGGKSNPNIFAITASLLLLWVTISTTSALSMTLTQDGNFGGNRLNFDILPGICYVLPDSWTNTVTSMGHSDCVMACPNRNCQGQLSCVRFDGAGNLDFSNNYDFNDKFNSFMGC